VALPGGLVDADIAIEDGRIAAIGNKLEHDDAAVVDAGELLVLPGMVDVHTHLEIESDGLTTTDDFTSGTVAAVVGGTTSIVDFAVQQPGLSLDAALDMWLDKLAAHRPVVDVGLHMMVKEVHSREAEQDLLRIAARGVSSFKLFMAFKDWMVDEETIFRTARAARACGGVVMVHAESGGIIETLIADAVDDGETAADWHARTRPPETEAAAIAQAVQICEMAGAPVYIMHVTSELAVGEVIRAQRRGAAVWAETCPQYLTFTSDVLHQDPDQAARFVFTPPPRTSQDISCLWSSLERGVISVVSTDHTPYTLSEKRGRRFDRIPHGAPGIEHRLAVMFDGVRRRAISLERMIDVCARTPAKLFGLWPAKGEIRVGADADVILFDPMGETAVSTATSYSRADHSLYEGMSFPGAIRGVYLGGELVVDDGVTTPALTDRGFVPRKPWLSRDSSIGEVDQISAPY
jgi:dihydropyrimidinase